EIPIKDRVQDLIVVDDKIFIAELIPKKITIYDLKGNKLDTWNLDNMPESLAHDNGLIYVLTSIPDAEVVVYNLNGTKQRSWTTTSGETLDITVHDDRVYVTTGFNESVEVYDLSGVLKNTWNFSSKITGIAANDDRIYVVYNNFFI